MVRGKRHKRGKGAAAANGGGLMALLALTAQGVER